jgi:hypothetical protein
LRITPLTEPPPANQPQNCYCPTPDTPPEFDHLAPDKKPTDCESTSSYMHYRTSPLFVMSHKCTTRRERSLGSHILERRRGTAAHTYQAKGQRAKNRRSDAISSRKILNRSHCGGGGPPPSIVLRSNSSPLEGEILDRRSTSPVTACQPFAPRYLATAWDREWTCSFA